MDKRCLQLKMTPEILKAIDEAEQKREKINRTPTIDLVKKENNIVGVEISKIVDNYGKDLSLEKLDNNEQSIVKEYLKILKRIIKQDMTMCKILPQCEIKRVLSLEKDLVGFFSREADINYLLKGQDDYFRAIYESLRLDYNNSKFDSKNEYMGMLIVRMPNFSLRTPIKKELSDDESLWRKIYIIEEPPYSGIGFIANKLCMPEFYISISDQSYDDKGKKFPSFPQKEFSASLNIIGHNSSIISLAFYDAGDFECAPDDGFVVYDKHKGLAKENGWL